jgi:serine/threonine protein kinase
MTPEVLSGADIKASTAQDIWAIGILAFQLLTGKVPFDSEANNLKAIKNDIISKPVQFP